MRVAIIGSRTIENIDISSYIPEEVTEIISGGAKGVDSLAEEYADKHRLSNGSLVKTISEKFIVRFDNFFLSDYLANRNNG